MIRPTPLKLLVPMVAIALSATVPAPTTAAPAPRTNLDTRLAQLFYPPASDRPVIAVTGQGRASLPADLARIEVMLTNRNPRNAEYPLPAPDASPKPSAEPAPITAAALADLVSALKAAGVPEAKIKVTINPLERSRFRYANNNGNAALLIELDQPTQERVGQLVKVVNGAMANSGKPAKIYLEDVYVQYVVNRCGAIEDAAYLAAMQDAKLRAAALAKSMGVQLAEVPSVAELPFLGRFYSPCSQDPDIVGTLFRRPAAAYNPQTPATVEIYREIAVTYRLR